MRILHILNHGEDGNGHVNVAVDLACFQSNAGHIVSFAGSGGPYKNLLTENNVKSYHFDLRKKSFFRVLSALRDLVVLLRSTRPEIVHAHMVASALLIKFLRPVFGYRIVCTVHNSFDKQSVLMAAGDVVVAVSEAVKAQMVSKGIRQKKLRVIRNGVIGTPRLKNEFKTNCLHSPAIGTLCGLHPRKGVQDLISAFGIIANDNEGCHLYIIGDGPMKEDYKSLAKGTGFENRIHFEGFQTDPRPFLYALDIFVMASHSDPFPLAILEARAAGCVLVGTNVDGIPEALNFGRAGLIAEPKNPRSLADKMNAVLNNPELVASLKENSSSTIGDYTLDSVSHKYLDVYKNLLTTRI